MTTLQAQQQALIDALFAWPPGPAEYRLRMLLHGACERGLLAYQSHGHALAQRALSAAYPVLQQMLGDESFAGLARAFWHAYPPVCGDVARWGEALASFVATSEQLSENPYLADVARAEWALHRCATAADAQTDVSSFSLLASADPAGLRLILCPAATVLRSAWPLVSILQAHSHSGSGISMAEVAQQLQAAVAQDVLIWRVGLQGQWRQAQPGEFEFLNAVALGTNVSAALNEAPALDFSNWLIPAVQSGLLVRVERLP